MRKSISSSSIYYALNKVTKFLPSVNKTMQVNKVSKAPSRIMKRCYHSSKNTLSVETVQITFVDSLDKEYTVPAEVGKSLLDVAHDNNIELEGACGGELACATCHLIFSQEIYDTLPEKEPEEDDMLDLAFELTDT